MDTRTAATAPPAVSQADEARAIEEIKRFMPETYKSIQDMARIKGNAAYAAVRRGLRGQANAFYAVERGQVMGTPFNLREVTDELARAMVQWGVTFLILWAPELVAQQPAQSDAQGV